MFPIPVMCVVIAVMTFIQISLWNIFPVRLRDLLMANTALAFFTNLAGSSLILTFTGVASVVGICNLGASVLFGIYSKIYAKRKAITGVNISWKKLFNTIPIYPSFNVIYGRIGEK